MRTDLEELRIQASLLLKRLRASDPAATARVRKALPELRWEAPEELQRKHALAVIAREQGHPSWAALKEALENAPAQVQPRSFDPERLFDRAGGTFLNRWFARYEDARASLDERGGFLFPYRHQFVVCEAGFLKAHGIDVNDPDWALIGRDWARPDDAQAASRLQRKLSTP